MKPKFYHATNQAAAPGKEFMLFAGSPAFFCEVVKSKTLKKALEIETAHQVRCDEANAPCIGSRTSYKNEFYSLLAIAIFEQSQNVYKVARIARKMADWYLFNILMKGDKSA